MPNAIQPYMRNRWIAFYRFVIAILFELFTDKPVYYVAGVGISLKADHKIGMVIKIEKKSLTA